MAINTKKYIESYLKIKDKRAKVIPLILNEAQMKLYGAIAEQKSEGKPVRVIVLKARQMGFSTATEAILFKQVATNKNVKAGIITHQYQATNNLFNMCKTFYNGLIPEIKPQLKNSNAKELVFNTRDGKGLNSSVKCMTAGTSAAGRSDTYNYLHISEYAFWGDNKEEIYTSLIQSVPNTNESMVIIESTANGFDDFKKKWDEAMRGDSDFIPVFCAWWELDEYRANYDGFILTAEEEEMKARYGLDNEQIAWRRWCIRNNCSNDINMFKQEYPSNPDEAFISTGSSVFNKEILIKRLDQLKDFRPLRQGFFTYKFDGISISNVKWVDDFSKPLIKIYADVEEKAPYVLGGDTAGEGSDFFIGEVINNNTSQQVAELCMQTDEDLYAKQMYCLGMYYNQALLGLEVNFSTFPQKELERLEYPNFYQRQVEDTILKTIELKYGFRTTSRTRPIIIANLVQMVREEPQCFYSAEFLRECLTFITNSSGRAEAEKGQHDDRVMAMAITHYIRSQQEVTTEVEVIKTKEQEREEYLTQAEQQSLFDFINYGVG